MDDRISQPFRDFIEFRIAAIRLQITKLKKFLIDI